MKKTPPTIGKAFLTNKKVKNVFPDKQPSLDEAQAKAKPSLSRSAYRDLKDVGVVVDMALLITAVADPNKPFVSFTALKRKALKIARLPTKKLPGYLKDKADPPAWAEDKIEHVRTLVDKKKVDL